MTRTLGFEVIHLCFKDSRGVSLCSQLCYRIICFSTKEMLKLQYVSCGVLVSLTLTPQYVCGFITLYYISEPSNKHVKLNVSLSSCINFSFDEFS